MPSASRHALGRFNLFGLMIDQQSEIMNSEHPTSSTLVVEAPYEVDHEERRFNAISYDPEQSAQAQGNSPLPEGNYRLFVHLVIHQGDRVATFEADNMTMSFIQPVTYHPIKLIGDMIRHLRHDIERSTGVLPMLRQIKHEDLSDIILHGEEAEALFNAHQYIDDINQMVVLTIPLWMGGTTETEIPLERCTLMFEEDIELTSSLSLLHPALRSYLLDVDSVSIHDDGQLL